MEWYIKLTESGMVPDPVIRAGIRRLLNRHLSELRAMDAETEGKYLKELVRTFSRGPIAEAPDKANEQHYEVPPEFYKIFLGPRMKYSGGYWTEAAQRSKRPERELETAENAMLRISCERAEIRQGQRILDLGCGWGAAAFYMAEHFPDCRITAVSGSRDQIDYISREARERGFSNIQAYVSDINDFNPSGTFDRIVSVEMFEHMKNYRELMRRAASWLTPEGKLFVHIFSHRRYCYEYPETGSWMARTFFTGGTMPSDDLLLHFQEHLFLEDRWRVHGRHYQNTLRAWLRNFDGAKKKIMPILADTYGPKNADRWFIYWRLFLMACEETFGLRKGNEYMVSHYRFAKKG